MFWKLKASMRNYSEYFKIKAKDCIKTSQIRSDKHPWKAGKKTMKTARKPNQEKQSSKKKTESILSVK